MEVIIKQVEGAGKTNGMIIVEQLMMENIIIVNVNLQNQILILIVQVVLI